MTVCLQHRIFRTLGFLLGCLAWGASPGASEEEIEMKSRLTPPAGSESTAAGEVEIEPGKLEVRVQGLAPRVEFGVFLDDGTGALVEVGVITTSGEERGEIEFHAGGDDGHAPLPFGVTAAGQLAGRRIEVRNPGGMVMLEGSTPDLRFNDHREGELLLRRPEPPVDGDATGEVELREKDGRLVIKVELHNLDPLALYEVVITDPDTGDRETLGAVTTRENGEGKLKLDTMKGDAVPFGVGSLADLVGFMVSVHNAGGAAVLLGTIEAVPTIEPPAGSEEKSESCLAATDPASGGGGKVEVEIEDGQEELEVEVWGLEPALIYSVVLRDPAGGAPETAGRLTTSRRGRGELEIKDGPFPFGATSVAELGGLEVAVNDPEGSAVLTGTVPELQSGTRCDDDGEDGGEAKVEVKSELVDGGERLRIELEHLSPGATYDVRLSDPGAGETETLATVTTDAEGKARVERDTRRGDTLPFGASSLAELAGFLVEVLDAGGTVVASAVVPLLDSDGSDGDGGGGGGVVLQDEFAIVGEFDSELLRGDSNTDQAVNLADAIHTLRYLFTAGDRPLCLDAADTNDDGDVDLGDPILTLFVLYRQPRPLPAPGSFIGGFDTTVDTLFCLEVLP